MPEQNIVPNLTEVDRRWLRENGMEDIEMEISRMDKMVSNLDNGDPPISGGNNFSPSDRFNPALNDMGEDRWLANSTMPEWIKDIVRRDFHQRREERKTHNSKKLPKRYKRNK